MSRKYMESRKIFFDRVRGPGVCRSQRPRRCTGALTSCIYHIGGGSVSVRACALDTVMETRNSVLAGNRHKIPVKANVASTSVVQHVHAIFVADSPQLPQKRIPSVRWWDCYGTAHGAPHTKCAPTYCLITVINYPLFLKVCAVLVHMMI